MFDIDSTVEHKVYTGSDRFSSETGKCLNFVEVDHRNYDGSPIYKRCGATYMSEEHFCAECQQMYEKRYPQGWLSYPGDTCEHGTYVGGCGEDHMCFACEQGDE